MCSSEASLKGAPLLERASQPRDTELATEVSSVGICFERLSTNHQTPNPRAPPARKGVGPFGNAYSI